MEPLAKLFGSPARLKMLRLFVYNKDTSYSVAEIAERTKLTRSVVRKELVDLMGAGFVRKKGSATPALYQTNARFEYLGVLDTFIRETTNVRPEHMVKSLKRAGTMRLIALSGLFTGNVETRVDLIVVGDNLDERALGTVIRTFEAELGREIRYASFVTSDFKYRLGVYDRLLRDVFDYPHRLLVDKIGV